MQVKEIDNEQHYYHNEKIEMYEEIFRVCPNVKDIFENDPENILYYLLERRITSLNADEMLCVWCTFGIAICNMYKKAIANKTAVV